MGSNESRITHTRGDYYSPDSHDLSALVTGRGATKVVASATALNPENADYVCSGTDDDVDILAAIATGREVVLSEGEFSIGATIVLPSNTKLPGAGRGVTLLKAQSGLTDPIIQSVGASASSMNSRITISDLSIDGNSEATKGLYFKWAKQLSLDNVYVYSCDKQGLHMVTCWDSIIRNVEFWDCGDLSGTVEQVRLEREVTDYLNNITFLGCRFEGNPYQNIVVGANCRKVRFFGCKLHGIIGSPVAQPHLNFQGEDGGLFGCNVTLSGAMGIYLVGGGDRFSIVGCNVDNCTTYGLQVADFQGVSLDANHFHTNTSADVYLGANANLADVRIGATNVLSSTTPIVVHANVDKDEVMDESAGARVSHSYMQSNVVADQSAVALDVLGLAGNTEITMPNPGSIIAISIASNTARTAGTLTVDATKNGTATGLQAVLDASNTQYHQAKQFQGADDFATGDRLGVKITTDGDWLPVTADVVVTVVVALR